MKIKQIMTDNVYALQDGDTLIDAADLMAKHDIGIIPIIDVHGKINGVITDRDIVIKAVAQNISVEEPIKRVMSNHIHTVKTEDDVGKAVTIMSDFQIRRLPVVNEENELIGMISIGDIAVNESTDLKAGHALSEVSMPPSDHESNPFYGTKVDDFRL